jgi:hypothetical protein
MDKLYSIPRNFKDDNQATFQVFEPNAIHQMDLLFLPTDRAGFKYALVVVDANTKKCDARPLKTKTPDAVLSAIKRMYKDSPYGLVRPDRIEVDSGNEFKGVFKTYFENEGTYIRRGLPNRHKQQALVENKNLQIGKYLLRKMAEIEIMTKKPSKAWLKNLPIIVEKINEKVKPTVEDQDATVKETTYNKKILAEGTKVRIKLDFPIDSFGKKLPGDFRASDIRWSREVHMIKQILLKPGQPPLYLIDKKGDTIARAKHEFQVVKP